MAQCQRLLVQPVCWSNGGRSGTITLMTAQTTKSRLPPRTTRCLPPLSSQPQKRSPYRHSHSRFPQQSAIPFTSNPVPSYADAPFHTGLLPSHSRPVELATSHISATLHMHVRFIKETGDLNLTGDYAGSCRSGRAMCGRERPARATSWAPQTTLK